MTRKDVAFHLLEMNPIQKQSLKKSLIQLATTLQHLRVSRSGYKAVKKVNFTVLEKRLLRKLKNRMKTYQKLWLTLAWFRQGRSPMMALIKTKTPCWFQRKTLPRFCNLVYRLWMYYFRLVSVQSELILMSALNPNFCTQTTLLEIPLNLLTVNTIRKHLDLTIVCWKMSKRNLVKMKIFLISAHCSVKRRLISQPAIQSW